MDLLLIFTTLSMLSALILTVTVGTLCVEAAWDLVRTMGADEDCGVAPYLG